MKKKLILFTEPTELDSGLNILKKHFVIQFILYIVGLLMGIFGILNLTIFEEQRFFGYFNVLVFILIVLSIIDFKRNQNMERSSFIVTVLLFSFFITIAIVNHNRSYGLIWTFFFPIYSISFNGHKRGLYQTVFYYIILFSITFYGAISWNDPTWDLPSFVRFFLASLLIVYLIMIIEISQFRAHLLLLEKDKKMQSYIEKLEQLSSIDTLTQLFNRRKFDELLKMAFTESVTKKIPLSLVILDIDDFKEINDKYGHQQGDNLLVAISNVIREFCNEWAVVGRWGGEEFILFVQGDTLNNNNEKLEFLRDKIESISLDKLPKKSCSFGLTQLNLEKDSITKLINRADKALYEAKSCGKNCIKIC